MKFRITFDRYENGRNKFVEVEADCMDALISALYENKLKEVCEEWDKHYSNIVKIEDCSAQFVELCIDDDFDDDFEE